MKPIRQVAIQINAESMVAYGAVRDAESKAVYLAVDDAINWAVHQKVPT